MPQHETEEPNAAELRDKMVLNLREQGVLTNEIENAMRAVPREVFAPGIPLAEVYDPVDAVVTKRDEHGMATSSVSAPWLQAVMLKQARIGSGMRVLEIGSGGYNAALMKELVGPDGEVTTVDIDPFVTTRARRFLTQGGYGNVNVVTGDGALGARQHMPEQGWDAIVITAGAWDVSPGLVSQLAPEGRLVVPLRINGFTRSIALKWEDGHLVSESLEECGFVPMTGLDQHDKRLFLLHGEEIGLSFDEHDVPDPARLTGALESERTVEWTGVTIAPTDSFGTLQMQLAATQPGFAILSVDEQADTTMVLPLNRRATPAVVRDRSFAYLTKRRAGDIVEFGVIGHGPDAKDLVGNLVTTVTEWDSTYQHRTLHVRVFAKETPDEQLPPGEPVLDKRHSRLTFFWT
ncbi:methyltransferase, FxLD system [Streptomyces endophyticus]|uniref:Protein-L-isoaspartate O-methyltransferase n=1 Tax=Streptomyces endophyticus TaxID=714166 RepID=A0ABU6F6Z2_9ACTN|nr:methyltransferase, FxLD system [Streptomyces endophyticus]MEB8339770.1 methyltransferase, FxLD system [Streptomyces endophyticus]